MISLGVDVGGTNTDIILGGLDSGVVVHKLPSTQDDPARATVQGTLEICELASISPGDIELVLHGTTVATNALLEHDGGRTGMLTTEGFRDIIHIGRHQRPHNFSLMQDIPYQRWPLVERKHRKAVPERSSRPARSPSPLDEERRVRGDPRAERLGRRVDLRLLPVLVPHPVHEQRAGELIAEHFPEAEVSLSHEVIAQFREFERFTTTAVNAYLKPRVRRYLERLERGWRDARRPLPDPRHAVQRRRGGDRRGGGARGQRLLSGPAAGVIAGAHIGRANGHEQLITLDIGGTSADICVIPGRLLELNRATARSAATRSSRRSSTSTAIGAGGGSIAWRDAAARSTSGRAARAPTPDPPATAAAAPSRPSPTRTSCSAASTPSTSSPAGWRSTPAPP